MMKPIRLKPETMEIIVKICVNAMLRKKKAKTKHPDEMDEKTRTDS